MDQDLYRAADACINRTIEGIRVCEDIVRFILNRTDISIVLKNIRHEILATSEVFGRDNLIRSRDVSGDGQKYTANESELKRLFTRDIFSSNIHRACEGLRSLEEFSKTKDQYSSDRFKSARFAMYDLEKRAVDAFSRQGKLSFFNRSLYAILDEKFIPEGQYLDAARRMIDGGASVIQLRMKAASSALFLQTAAGVRAICDENKAVFITNDRADIAIAANAHGLHLGRDDISVMDARRIIPSGMIIGTSTHSIEDILSAIEQGPDYIAIGPIFGTGSKGPSQLSPVGIDLISQARKMTDLPIVAIGGINPSNIKLCIDAGADCAAIISALYENNHINENCKKIIGIIRDQALLGI